MTGDWSLLSLEGMGLVAVSRSGTDILGSSVSICLLFCLFSSKQVQHRSLQVDGRLKLSFQRKFHLRGQNWICFSSLWHCCWLQQGLVKEWDGPHSDMAQHSKSSVVHPVHYIIVISVKVTLCWLTGNMFWIWPWCRLILFTVQRQLLYESTSVQTLFEFRGKPLKKKSRHIYWG